MRRTQLKVGVCCTERFAAVVSRSAEHGGREGDLLRRDVVDVLIKKEMPDNRVDKSSLIKKSNGGLDKRTANLIVEVPLPTGGSGQFRR